MESEEAQAHSSQVASQSRESTESGRPVGAASAFCICPRSGRQAAVSDGERTGRFRSDDVKPLICTPDDLTNVQQLSSQG